MKCRHLEFLTSDFERSLPDSATNLPEPENMQIAVGIYLLSCIAAEIQVLPVW
jgi:hypothetical protein